MRAFMFVRSSYCNESALELAYFYVNRCWLVDAQRHVPPSNCRLHPHPVPLHCEL